MVKFSSPLCSFLVLVFLLFINHWTYHSVWDATSRIGLSFFAQVLHRVIKSVPHYYRVLSICGWKQTVWMSSRCFFSVLHMIVWMPNMYKWFASKRCYEEQWLHLCFTHFAQISWGSLSIPKVTIQSLCRRVRTQLQHESFNLDNKCLKHDWKRNSLSFTDPPYNFNNLLFFSSLSYSTVWCGCALIYFAFKQ